MEEKTGLDKTRCSIIISHYNENLDWAYRLPYNATIVSKEGIPAETAPNKGCEASGYLEYIIKKYASLPDWLIFVHGHRSSWHHRQNMDEILPCLVIGEHKYCNINDFYGVWLCEVPEFNVCKIMLPELFSILDLKFGDADIEKIKYRPCSQFYVSNTLIYRYPVETYIRLHEWIMNCQQHSYWSGRMFEYIWHIMFTGKLEDENLQTYRINVDGEGWHEIPKKAYLVNCQFY